jgi:hypothetical protein
MDSKRNLVPTPTVDKNGKLTTVYRRQEDTAGKGRVLPAPVVARNPDLIRNVSFLLTSAASEPAIKMNASKQIAGYSSELLQRIHDAITDETLEKHEQDMLKANFLHKIGSGSTLPSVEEAVLFFPLMTGLRKNSANEVISSLRCYPQLPKSSNYAREREDVQKKCSAIVRVMGMIYLLPQRDFRFERGSYVFSDDRLTDLVLEFPERADEIGTIIVERRSFDPDMIRSVLTTDASALGSGIL